MGNLSLQDMPIPFKEKERFFLTKTEAERCPSLCGDVIIRFMTYGHISRLYELLRDYNEYDIFDTVFQVTITENHDVFQCKTDFYRAMVEYFWSLWGQ